MGNSASQTTNGIQESPGSLGIGFQGQYAIGTVSVDAGLDPRTAVRNVHLAPRDFATDPVHAEIPKADLLSPAVQIHPLASVHMQTLKKGEEARPEPEPEYDWVLF